MPDTITPPTGPEMNLSDLKSTDHAKMPNSIMEAALKAAGVVTPPEPPDDPAPVAPKAPATKPAPPAPPAAKIEPEPPKPKKDGIESLREAHERQSAKLKELENSVTATTREKSEAMSKLADIEEKFRQAEERRVKEYEPARIRLVETEKKLQEREEALRIRDYTATTEWHEKYERPLAEAQSEAGLLLSELEVQNADGTMRRANEDDFNAILQIPSVNAAGQAAEEKFGKYAAPQIMNLRQRIMQGARARKEGLKNAQLQSAEWQKNAESSQLQRQQQMREKMQAEINRIVGLEPDIFQPAEDDQETHAAIREGFALADSASTFDVNNPDKFARDVASARTEIAAAKVLRKHNAKLKAELAETKELLKGYQNSEPDVIARRTDGNPPSAKDDMKAKLTAAAMALARQR